MKTLTVELNKKFTPSNDTFKAGSGVVMITPDITPEYWLLRVKLSKKQAIVAFPKFGTIGIGFAVEDGSWNTNLPYSCDAKEIYNHIKCNKGQKHIKEVDCIRAIEAIQAKIPTRK